jgi:hypothetical protein
MNKNPALDKTVALHWKLARAKKLGTLFFCETQPPQPMEIYKIEV